MARCTGAVRFPDGLLMYFVYNATVDTARPLLFSTPDEADAAWDLVQDRSLYEGCDPLTDEVVAVMPYFSHGDTEVLWTSTANRESKRITGPLAMD